MAAGGKIKLDDDITLKSRINCKRTLLSNSTLTVTLSQDR